MKSLLKITCGILCIILCVIAICAFDSLGKNSRLFVSVNSFELPKNKKISIGDESDVCFHKIPHDFLSISYENGHYKWQVNNKYFNADDNELCYFKINNENVNRYEFDSGSDVVTVNYGNNVYSMSKNDIDRTLSDLERPDKGVNQYVFLRNVIGKCNQNNDIINNRNITSFLFRKHDGDSDWELIILDKYTELIRGNETCKYKYEGKTKNAECKIQFFYLDDNSTLSGAENKKIFQLDSLKYTLAPRVLLTEWGAGHIMLRPSDNNRTMVYFPKPITYVESVDTLRKEANDGKCLLTLRQMDGSFPISKSVYIPNFSNCLRQDICNIRLDALKVDTTNIFSHGTWLPQFDEIENVAGSGVNVHVRLLDGKFFRSYLWWPLVFLLVLFMGYLILIKRKGDIYFNAGPTEIAKNIRFYSVGIFVLLGIYMICKLLISIKLSFTYPYFEKISAIIEQSVCMALLLVFNLIVLLNYEHLSFNDKDGKSRSIAPRLWGITMLSLIGLFAACLINNTIEQSLSVNVLRSYLYSEELYMNSWCNRYINLLAWRENYAMNDLHRTVPFILQFVNGLCTIILFSLAVRYTIWPTLKWSKLPEKIVRKIKNKIPQKIKKICAKAYPISFLIIGGGAAWFLGGNWGSAILTVTIVLCISMLALKLYVADRPSCLGSILFLISIPPMCIGLLPGLDSGYITNILGGFLFFLILWFYIRKYKGNSDGKEVSRVTWGWFVSCVLAFCLCSVFLNMWLSPDKIDYGRSSRRLNLYANYDKTKAAGYEYSDSDVEFMVVLSHYMHNNDASDPLSDKKMLHPSVSTGQSPVILNDVSLPAAFIGAYGWKAKMLYYGLWIVLLLWVLSYTLYPDNDKELDIDKKTLWRLLSVCMWCGTTIWLSLSYRGIFPFTGRLNPGFGVDAVGEVLETSVLLAFMLSVSLKREEKKK